MKKCKKCALIKHVSEFRPNKKRKDGLQTYCIMCDKAFQKEWYLKNKDKCIEKTKTRNEERRKISQKFIVDYLFEHPCIDCGETNILVLEFDHVFNNKKFGIAKMIRSGTPVKAIQKEINKCEVRCANCHKIKTAKQFGWYKLDFLPNAGSGISLQN